MSDEKKGDPGIRKICSSCRFLGEADEPYRATYVACHWPLPELPVVSLGWQMKHAHGGSDRWITRKAVAEEDGVRLLDCPTWEAATAEGRT